MKRSTIVRSGALRLLACLLTIGFAACSSAGSHLLPTSSTGSTAAAPAGDGSMALRLRSASGSSIGVAFDGGAQQIFDTAGGCARICTFKLRGAATADSLTITSYSGARGTGMAIDRVIATVPTVRGRAVNATTTLGPVVTTIADKGKGSLRWAVGSANDGDTITFKLANNAKIVLSKPISIIKTVTIAGPGVSSGITVSGNNKHQIFAIEGNLTVSGLIVSEGHAAVSNAPGGAFFNSGTLVLSKDTIGASTSAVSAARHAIRPHLLAAARMHPNGCTTTYAFGGAVYNDATFVSSGTTYSANVVKSDMANCIQGEGGAIYNDGLGTIDSSNDTFSANSALAGGAVFNAGLGGTNFVNDTFSKNQGCNANSGCATSGCTNTGCTSYAVGEGAAIFDNGEGVTIASSTFSDNVAGGPTAGSSGLGGALFLAAGVPSIGGSTFAGNRAGGGKSSCSSGEGGAIAAAIDVRLDNNKFVDNVASGDKTSAAGAILAQFTLTGSNDTFTGNQALAWGSACSKTSEGVGGAVYGQTTVAFDHSSFTANKASANSQGAGGALGGNAVILTSDTFDSNVAAGTGDLSAASTAGGGAVLGATAIKSTNCTYTSNAVWIHGTKGANVYGGAVMLQGTFLSSGDTFDSNTVKAVTNTTTIAAGGAVTVVSGAASISDDSFKSNAISSTGTAGGGALYTDANAIVHRTTFDSNTAAGQQSVGGAMASGAQGELVDATFTNNSATATGGEGGGGAIYDNNGLSINSSTISGNTATTLGGGIVTIANEELVNTIVTGNTVTKSSVAQSGGGGIFAHDAIVVQGSTVSNNTVTVSTGKTGGGGIYDGGGLTLIQSTISGNAVLGTGTASGGGGIYIASDAQLEDSTITGNAAKGGSGGGIDVLASATVELDNDTLYQNTAKIQGGNVNNAYALTLANSIVAGGKAPTGPDIHSSAAIASGDYNIVQTPVAGTAMGGTTTHNLKADPKLLGLAKNGGPTQTNADQSSSPGKSYIPFASSKCNGLDVPYDQRSYTRGAGGKCDAGAYEFSGVPAAARPVPAIAHRARHAAPLFPAISFAMPALHLER